MLRNEVYKEIIKGVVKQPRIIPIRSRRNALKSLALFTLCPSLGAARKETIRKPSPSKKKILIVGGGLAGISTAARLCNALEKHDITIIEPEALSPSYQAGLTLVASGVWNTSQILYNIEDKIPHGVTLIKGRATAFDPKNNTLIVDDKDEVGYDQLIIATGLCLDYAAIKGLDGEVSSFAKDTNSLKNVGLTKNGLHSMYFKDGASATYKAIKQLIQQAKEHKGPSKLQAVFTHPNTLVKSDSSSKEIMYLVHSRLVEAGVRDKVTIIFKTSKNTMHDIRMFHEAIVEQFEKRNFIYSYHENLIEIDATNKVASFEKLFSGARANEKKEISYDFIHVTPPMKVHKEIATSALASPQGYIPVNKETLQHLKFSNVWSLGDVAEIAIAKSASSILGQHKVIVDNILAIINKKSTSKAKYDGYNAKHFITGLGTAMLLEYDWKMEPIQSLPLKPTQERWIWWMMQIYVLKPLRIHKMMKGYA